MTVKKKKNSSSFLSFHQSAVHVSLCSISYIIPVCVMAPLHEWRKWRKKAIGGQMSTKFTACHYSHCNLKNEMQSTLGLLLCTFSAFYIIFFHIHVIMLYTLHTKCFTHCNLSELMLKKMLHVSAQGKCSQLHLNPIWADSPHYLTYY